MLTFEISLGPLHVRLALGESPAQGEDYSTLDSTVERAEPFGFSGAEDRARGRR